MVDLLQVSLAEKTGEGKKRKRLVILGMLINIHEQSSLASIDPGCQVLQVSLAFIPSPVFAARETCSKSTVIVVSVQLAGNFYAAMKLAKPIQFDVLKVIKVIPQLRNTPCAISRFQTLVSGPQNSLSW